LGGEPWDFTTKKISDDGGEGHFELKSLKRICLRINKGMRGDESVNLKGRGGGTWTNYRFREGTEAGV